MALTHIFRRLPAACWFLLAWVVFCLGWVVAARKPWQTLALVQSVSVKETPREDFIAAGLWIGLLVSGGLGALLVVTCRWWGGPRPAPIHAGPGATAPALSRNWFFLVVGGLMSAALWQCWPALTLSFWGDEAMMFTDFVHGQWRPAAKGGSLQEALTFRSVSWPHAFFCDYYGANHWLSTHLQRLVLKGWQSLAGQPVWCFEEWVVRLVPLGAGMAAIAAMASWLRWLGRPLAGLAAAGFLALHPAHLRFCVEARGYSLLLLFFVLTLWAIGRALRHGRKRDWVLVGVGQFLMMYSWKGAVYGLVFVNAVLAVRLLLGPVPPPAVRRVVLARWFAAGVLGAMLFIPLTASSQLQIRKSIETTRKRAKPMDEVWRNNLISQTLIGVPWNEMESANPHEVSIERLRRQSAATTPALVVVGLALILGLARVWRQDRLLAGMSFGVLASGVVAALHFKFGLRVELLTWYLVYQLPVVAVVFGIAITPGSTVGDPSRPPRYDRLRILGRSAFAAVALAGFATVAAPMVADFRRHPREDYKRAVEWTRGVHEPRGFSGPSVIRTAWLWRHTPMYDPRGDTHVQTPESLEETCRLARNEGGEFYMIVGMRQLSEGVFPEVMKRLRDPRRFDRVGTLWGGEPINTLEVYRLRRNGPSPEAPGTTHVHSASRRPSPSP